MVKIINDYTLLEQIGAGSYGSVYKAKHKSNNDLYAVKVIPIEKFHEIQKLEQCINNQIKVLTMIESNPYIIKYYERMKSKSNYYFVYEYCNGGTLENHIKKMQKIVQKDALKIFSQLQSAFKILNKHNIMHRDLKPQNIFIDNGRIKLGDFGFCKDLQSDDSLAKTMLGSPIYMAPQVLKGHMYTSKTDIWSLGIILYQMLFGQCPYNSKNIFDLISNIETMQIKFPSQTNVSEKTKNLIRRMLVRDSFRRISWAQLLRIQINEDGQYIQEKDTGSHKSKSFTINSNNISHKQSLEQSIDQNNLKDSANLNKKSASLNKSQKQKVFYSQNFIELLSSKNISIDGINDRTAKKNTYQDRISRKCLEDQPIETENKVPLKKISENKQIRNSEQKREKIIKIHDQIVKQMQKALYNFENDRLRTIKDVYIKLKEIQQKIKKTIEVIKMTQLQLLDLSSILSYEKIQIQRFILELRQYMSQQHIQIPAFHANIDIIAIF